MTTTPCIDYQGSKNTNGYGIRGKRPQLQMHRVAYCESRGVSLESIKGYVVRHTCDRPPCVNPEHLLLGTANDNVQDKVDRGRQCYGERNAMARMTDEMVKQMRAMQKELGLSQRRLAKAFGVSQTTAYRVVARKAWAHVT
jgi:hypothetical protein